MLFTWSVVCFLASCKEGQTCHGKILSGHVIVHSDPGSGTWEKADQGARRGPVDDNVLSGLTCRWHMGQGHPEDMIGMEFAIVHDGRSPCCQRKPTDKAKRYRKCPHVGLRDESRGVLGINRRR